MIARFDLVVGHRGDPRVRVASGNPTLLRIATVAANRPDTTRVRRAVSCDLCFGLEIDPASQQDLDGFLRGVFWRLIGLIGGSRGGASPIPPSFGPFGRYPLEYPVSRCTRS